jgi:hypothetical protein
VELNAKVTLKPSADVVGLFARAMIDYDMDICRRSLKFPTLPR